MLIRRVETTVHWQQVVQVLRDTWPIVSRLKESSRRRTRRWPWHHLRLLSMSCSASCRRRAWRSLTSSMTIVTVSFSTTQTLWAARLQSFIKVLRCRKPANCACLHWARLGVHSDENCVGHHSLHWSPRCSFGQVADPKALAPESGWDHWLHCFQFYKESYLIQLTKKTS